MYRHFRHRRNGKHVLFSTNGRAGNFRMGKSFDPTDFINNFTPSVQETAEEKIENTFNDFKISETLRNNIFSKGYTVPTPIQDKCIKPLLEGRDVIGIANTGTGKTAAFLIPLIEKAIKDRNQEILIVTPTRELALQINEEFWAFTKGLGIYSVLCIGGTNIKRQIRELYRRPNFVIGTPGRILDLYKSRHLHLENFQNIVLDETDRMVDIGFLKDIKFIISLLPQNRQSLFFSATVAGKAREILFGFVKDPVVISVQKTETTKNIQQKTIRIEQRTTKMEKLYELLEQKDFEKVLIFGRTKHGVQRLSDSLKDRGFRSGAIHGNKNQSQRVSVLEKFKKSEINILIATDVASRGLDIPNVSHVINYDLPESKDVYIHRIGRTGRADQKGVALTFI